MAEGLPLCSFLASGVGEGVHNRLEQDGRAVPRYPRLDKMTRCLAVGRIYCMKGQKGLCRIGLLSTLLSDR